MAQVIGFLLSTWETWNEFLSPGSSASPAPAFKIFSTFPFGKNLLPKVKFVCYLTTSERKRNSVKETKICSGAHHVYHDLKRIS